MHKLAYRFHFIPVASIIVIAILATVLVYVPVNTPDSDRFLEQAASIVSGKGYRYMGALETFLPPGYPMFIALIKFFGGNDYALRGMQVFLFITSCTLIFFSIMNSGTKSPLLAMIGGIALAIHPTAVRFVGYILSETFALFLCSLLMFFASTVGRDPFRKSSSFCFGVLAVALALTSPAAIVLCACLFIYMLGTLILAQRVSNIALLFVGSLIVMLPWQWHCIQATGSICPTLYTRNPVGFAFNDNEANGYYQWFRTWSTGEMDIEALVKKDPSKARSTDFSADAELIDRVRRSTELTNDSLAALNKFYYDRAARNREDSSIRQLIGLPLLRSFTLWFYMPQISHVQMEYVGRLSPADLMGDYREYGAKIAALRFAKSLLSTIIYLLYITYPIFLIAALVIGVWQRNPMILLICGSILVYTLISGFTALGESRRNIVFAAAILYLLGLISSDRASALIATPFSRKLVTGAGRG